MAQEDFTDRSTGDLMKQLAQDMGALFRQEVELAKAEMTEKGKRFGIGAGIAGAGGVIGLLALFALTICLIAALAIVMPGGGFGALALSGLIVAVVYGLIAAVLFKTGQGKIKQASPPVPEQTVETVKEDVEWAKTRVRSGTK